MKKISILIPTFNEEGNVLPLSQEILKTMDDLNLYDYEIIFIDNYSIDNTRMLLRKLCSDYKKIKAIFNIRNFEENSLIHGLRQTTGDCTIVLDADFQTPIELIPEFIKNWEDGYRIVIGIDSSSNENALMYFIRSLFYKMFSSVSEIRQIKHFHAFGLYDKTFLDVIRNLSDPYPDFRGLVSQLGSSWKEIHYSRPKRRTGKTHFSLYKLYDFAMKSFTSYSKIFLRIPIFLGFGIGFLSFIIAVYYFILKFFIRPGEFLWGIAAIAVGVFFLGSIQLIFIGLLGEYVMAINTRIMNRPLVIEEERINFDK